MINSAVYELFCLYLHLLLPINSPFDPTSRQYADLLFLNSYSLKFRTLNIVSDFLVFYVTCQG